MRLSNCVNLVQKISAFTLVYFFSFSSYQAQIIPDKTLVNNSRVNSGYSVCNQDSNPFDNFNEFSIFASKFSIFDSQGQIENVFNPSYLAAANLTLSNYLAISSVLNSRSIEYFDKFAELASFGKGINKLKTSLVFNTRVLFKANSDCNKCEELWQRHGIIACNSLYCDGCDRCSNINP